jgi:RimJ/RimL family protein N-acetyltransferase
MKKAPSIPTLDDVRAAQQRIAPYVDGASIELSIPQEGIVFDGLILRLPTTPDLDRMPSTFAEPDALTRTDFAECIPHLETLVASGQLVPLVVADVQTGEILGGGTFRHLDSKGAIIEIGYWLYPHARGGGVATKTACALADHAFRLGIRRVVAHVKVGNDASDRVLERAGFTREGISRSMPTADGGRIDKTVWSLLPGD